MECSAIIHGVLCVIIAGIIASDINIVMVTGNDLLIGFQS